MVQRCQDFGLTAETKQPVRIARKLGREYLDRDLAFELCVARSIDFAHPTRTDKTQDFVMPDARIGRERSHFSQQSISDHLAYR